VSNLLVLPLHALVTGHLKKDKWHKGWKENGGKGKNNKMAEGGVVHDEELGNIPTN
jgi:hypothetical protein